jgi:hypothetical protein
MSIIPTALGGGQRLDQLMMATDVFDTAGTSSWTHPSPGTALEVQVTLVGGAGGGTTGSAAGNGTPSIWDTSGTPIIAGGGSGSVDNNTPGTGFISGERFYSSGMAGNKVSIFDGLFGNAGHTNDPNTTSTATGGSGYWKKFSATVTGNVGIVVGSAGSVGEGGGVTDSQNGAVIVSYAKAAVGIPAPVQKEFVEEWLDWDSTVSGSGTWTHPRPGQAITMTVICVGGAGGNSFNVDTDGSAGNGGDTTFDTVVGAGGNGGSDSSDEGGTAPSGGINGGYQSSNGSSQLLTGFGTFGAVGPSKQSNSVYQGSTGGVKIGRITVTGNVNYSIGAGGTEDADGQPVGAVGDGYPGGIILKYSY